MRKILTLSTLLVLLAALSGCMEQKAEISIAMPSFEAPLGAQVLSMSDVDMRAYKDQAEIVFQTKVLGYRSTEINFEKAHDLGYYDRTVDIQIQDFIFENAPSTPEAYLTQLEKAWGVEGEKSTLTSATGLDFLVWSGASPVYEANMVLYVTQYTDAEGQKHFVEISRMGTDHEAIKSALQPVVDSLEF
jgi:hypothetical protein